MSQCKTAIKGTLSLNFHISETRLYILETCIFFVKNSNVQLTCHVTVELCYIYVDFGLTLIGTCVYYKPSY